MNGRIKALEEIGRRAMKPAEDAKATPFTQTSEHFGRYVFNRSTMQRMLPPAVYENVIRAREGKEKIQAQYADTIAGAMKDWACSLGATHFTHWFQPLTGTSAAKHDAFIDWHANDLVIEKFGGKQLLQGEPDASSLPHGGLRSTFEARGYTGWDPTSAVFVWRSGSSTTLCVPSVFFSWNGEALDHKLPLLRAEKKLAKAVLRLLQLTGIEANSVHTTLGFEQEYFLIDRALRDLRPDLVIAGRTLLGAPSAKGQQLQDHYFGSVKKRVLSFMHDFEQVALGLGIPVKTRHNEVAPSQHEVAPVYEKASIAIDHNVLLMDIMVEVAVRHNLSCLLHEKPFAGLNGSGKHINWSLVTDTGINLLNPTDTPENTAHFLILLTAVLSAVHRHGALLRASIGSAGNDLRLGGHEAPPAILSVYLGEVLEQLLEEIEHKGEASGRNARPGFDFGMLVIPELARDYTDRNRTSPFAFTGSKFEFRALGSAANPSFAVTVLNTVVAESLDRLVDAIEQHIKKLHDPVQLHRAILPVIRKEIKQSKAIRFSGDNYSLLWMKEAKKRKLPNQASSFDAYDELFSASSKAAFAEVLSVEELKSRQEILIDIHGHKLAIEAQLFLELFRTSVLPAAVRYVDVLSKSMQQAKEFLPKKSAARRQTALVCRIHLLIEKGLAIAEELDGALKEEMPLDARARAKRLRAHVMPRVSQLRSFADELEVLVDDALWPFPKYRELLFIL